MSKRIGLPKRTEAAAVTAHSGLTDVGSNDHHTHEALFEEVPTDGEVGKAPTSNWARDHGVDSDAHHNETHSHTAAAVTGYAVGTYSGTAAANRVISVGFTPTFVICVCYSGGVTAGDAIQAWAITNTIAVEVYESDRWVNNSDYFGGIVSGGFNCGANGGLALNGSGENYMWMALK